MSDKIKIGVIGASGYTGADLIRLAARHPNVEIKALTANTHAGKALGEVFPHLASLNLPKLQTMEEVDWASLDVAFCGLPHGTAQDIIADLPDALKVIDMSADFRLRNAQTYQQWYGREHSAPELQKHAVYGLSEHYRDEIKDARLVACPGCYPTAALLLLLPLVAAGLVDTSALIIDAKSGVSGAGRGLRQSTLFSEAGEGLSPYSVTGHRHAPEIEQELSLKAGKELIVNFTPHLIPMTRGELLTVYVNLPDGKTASDVRNALSARYANEPFVQVVAEGIVPATQHVRGSNTCLLGVFEDRIPGRAILISTLDNLVKGSSGQALQNMNIMFGLDETLALEQLPLFP